MNPTTPTLAPTPAPSLGRIPAIISLILGILGIGLILTSYGFFLSAGAFALLSFAFMIGIIGLIIALTSKRKAPKNKARRAGTVTNIITIAWSLITIGGFGIVAVAGFLFQGGASTPSAARAASDAQIAEPKDFAYGEVAHIGAWDVTITKVTRDYQPTSEEYKPRPTPVDDLTDATDEFIVVEGTKTPNGKTEAVSLANGYLKVNGYHSVAGEQKERFLPSLKSTSSSSYTFRFVFRIKQGSEALVLTYPVSIYTAISPIVGTEGMPHESVVYTIALN